MLFGLAQRGDAPHWLLDTTASGVPLKAILLSTVFGYVGVALDYISPGTVFLFLLNSSGAIALFVYLLISLSEIRMRRDLEREQGKLLVPMWGYPYLSICTAALMVVVIASLAVHSDTRSQLLMSVVSIVICFALFYVKRFNERRTGTQREPATLAADTTSSPDGTLVVERRAAQQVESLDGTRSAGSGSRPPKS